MKKSKWKRKAAKRIKRIETDKGIVDFIMIIKHFFKNMPDWISEMTDPRHLSYITYTQADLFYMGVMKNACSVESMRQMEDLFNEENCILIRSKAFNKARLLDRYWCIILDGTGLFSFKERHCQNCLKRTIKCEDGSVKVVYSHKVLEAKLVLGDGFVISLGTEFIENENENVTKQDCEINAAKRLLPRIKKAFPRLKVVLQADALYETETFMKICREELKWEYLFTHKDTRQRFAGESYGALEEKDKEKKESIGAEKGTGWFYNGIDHLAGKKEIMNILEYDYEYEEKGKRKRKHFWWVTSIRVTKRNLEKLIEGGRGRWQIENEGFNMQKNSLYYIEHINSYDPTGMKNHYLLTQITDILMQLYIRKNIMVREFGQSIKNTSSRLLESFRRHTVTVEDVLYIERRTTVYLE